VPQTTTSSSQRRGVIVRCRRGTSDGEAGTRPSRTPV
jgi:hypothetical protein